MIVSTLWQIFYWVWVASEIGLVIVTRTRRSTGETRDRGSILLLWPVIFFSIWFAMQYGATHPHTLLIHGSPRMQASFRPLGLALLVLGLAIRWFSILSLGRSFSVNVAIHSTQTVYRQGVYSVLRHPSYTGMLLIFLAIGLEARNWISLAVMMIFPTLALLYRIHVEEAALLHAFGPEYADYSRSTKRLLPGIY